MYRNYDIYLYRPKAVVINLAGGTEPHKFHTCIHRTLAVEKIKFVSWVLFFILLLLKISCRRTPETDSSNHWGSIEHKLRTTDLHCSKKISNKTGLNLYEITQNHFYFNNMSEYFLNTHELFCYGYSKAPLLLFLS